MLLQKIKLFSCLLFILPVPCVSMAAITISADTTYTGYIEDDDFTVDSGAILTIAQGAELDITSSVTLGVPNPGGSVGYIVVESGGRFDCTGPLTVAGPGICAISVPHDFSGPDFSTVNNTGGGTLVFQKRPEYTIKSSVYVNDAQDITVKVWVLGDGNVITDSDGLVDTDLTESNEHGFTGGVSYDNTEHVFTVFYDNTTEDIYPDTLYTFNLSVQIPTIVGAATEIYRETFTDTISVMTPATGGDSIAAHSTAWWDEEDDQLKIRGWITKNDEFEDDGNDGSNDYIAEAAVEINGVSRGTPVLLNGLMSMDFDISESFLSRSGSYVIDTRLRYDPNGDGDLSDATYYTNTQSVTIPSEPSVVYNVEAEAFFDGTDGIYVRAVLKADGVIVSSGIDEDDSTITIGGTSVTDAFSAGIFTGNRTGLIAGNTYMIQVNITAPDTAAYTDITSFQIPAQTSARYETYLSAAADESGDINIVTYLTANGILDTTRNIATDDHLDLYVDGAEITPALITEDAGEFTYTYSATPGTLHEILSVITGGDSNDYTSVINVYVPTSGAVAVVYEAHINAVYSTADDEIVAYLWLSVSGQTVTGLALTDYSISVTGPTSSGGASLVGAGGIYYIVYDGGLTTGTVYRLDASIDYGGNTYEAVTSVYVPASSGDLSSIESKIDDIDAIVDTIDANVDTIAADVTQIEHYTEAGILNRETTVRTGSDVTIRYRAPSGLTPAVSVYDPDDVSVISSQSMTEVGTTGIYQYNITFSQSWGTGDFTVICSESTGSRSDALVVSVVPFDATTLASDIEELSSDINNVSGTVNKIEESTEELSGITEGFEEFKASFDVISNAIAAIDSSIASGRMRSTVIEDNMHQMYDSLTSLSSQIKAMGADTKANFGSMFEVAADSKDDLQYLKNKSEELKAAMELSKKLLDDVANEPVIQTWYEFR